MTSSVCSSSVSARKTGASTAGSTCSNNRKKCCEAVCSSNSSCFLQRKKPVNPLATSVRSFRSDQNNVRQRVMSAKLVKLRSLQSQLNDANYHLMELAKENRALKTLQKRQDKALNSYEGVNADLPRLIKSHEEENRVLQEKNRSLKKVLRDLHEQVKIKDEELIATKDQLKHLHALSKDKRLLEREKLQEQLEDAKAQIKQYENEIILLNRKHMLEMKSSKQRLSTEISKHKRTQLELNQALGDVDRLGDTVQKELPKRRFGKATTKQQSVSMVCLTNSNSCSSSAQSTDLQSDFKDDIHSDSSSDIKLEPISGRLESSDSFKSHDLLQSPAEKIKARLSANITQITENLDRMSVEDEITRKNVYARSSRPPSTKLETLQKKVEVIADDTFQKCHEQMNATLAKAEALTEKHVETLNVTKLEDEKLMQELKEVDVIDKSIRNGKFSELILKDEDFEIVNKIWDEEYQFRKDTKGKNQEPTVALENKKKLLAALRDIDNGKSVEDDGEFNEVVEKKKHRLMKELFG